MASLKVLAGDFVTYAPASCGSLLGIAMITVTPKDSQWGSPKSYNVKTDVKSLTLANEQDGVRAFGAAGWGTVGALLAGPAGLIAGAILGGRGKDVTFIAEFNDGKKLLGRTDGKTWDKLLAARF